MLPFIPVHRQSVMHWIRWSVVSVSDFVTDLSVCPCYTKKMARAINTKLGWQRRSACTDQGSNGQRSRSNGYQMHSWHGTAGRHDCSGFHGLVLISGFIGRQPIATLVMYTSAPLAAAASTLRQATVYLPSQSVTAIDQHQVILLGDRGTWVWTLNNLPKVVSRQRDGRSWKLAAIQSLVWWLSSHRASTTGTGKKGKGKKKKRKKGKQNKRKRKKQKPNLSRNKGKRKKGNLSRTNLLIVQFNN